MKIVFVYVFFFSCARVHAMSLTLLRHTYTLTHSRTRKTLHNFKVVSLLRMAVRNCVLCFEFRAGQSELWLYPVSDQTLAGRKLFRSITTETPDEMSAGGLAGNSHVKCLGLWEIPYVCERSFHAADKLVSELLINFDSEFDCAPPKRLLAAALVVLMRKFGTLNYVRHVFRLLFFLQFSSE